MLKGSNFLPLSLNQILKNQYILVKGFAIACTFIALFDFAVKAQTAQWNYHKSDSLFKAGAYPEALQENFAALKFFEKSGSCGQIANAQIQVGRMYYFITNRAEATNWFRKSLAMAGNCGIDSLQGKCYRNLGSIFFENAQIDSATLYLEKARQLLSPYSNAKDMAMLFASLFEVGFSKNKNGLDTKRYLDSCALYSKLCGDPNQYAFYKIKSGRYYFETGNCEKAIGIFKDLVKYYQENHFKDGLMYTLSNLALAQAKCQLGKESIATLSLRDQIRDTIFQEKTAENLAKYQTLFETQKKEIENLELKRKNEWLVSFFTFGTLALLVLGFAGYKFQALRREQKRAIQIKEEQRQRFLEVIQVQEQERTRIAGDLHDGLGHLMSALKLNTSALEIQDEQNLKILGNAQSIIDLAAKEVRQISHQLMPQSLSEIGLVASLNELANRINPGGKIQVILQNEEEILLNRETQVAVYRIVQEVINNAIKHSEATEFRIRYSIKNGFFHLFLSDNGIGMDLNLVSNGIGWKNIRSRVEIINGLMQVFSERMQGVRIEIQIPLESQNQQT